MPTVMIDRVTIVVSNEDVGLARIALEESPDDRAAVRLLRECGMSLTKAFAAVKHARGFR